MGAFANCTRLTSINIPNSITTISAFAFTDCYRLPSINIPTSVTTIERDAFEFCFNLIIFTEFTSCPEGWSPAWNSTARPVVWGGANGSLEFTLIDNGTAYAVSRGTWAEPVVTIPAVYNNLPVTLIFPNGFSNCSSITSVHIPDSVTIIGLAAFDGCENLININIPNSVTMIDWGAFRYCASLTSIMIPNSVTEIGGVAFGFCANLTSINIPSSVTFIGQNAFVNCNKLIIYAEHQGQPEGWAADWNAYRPVVWGGTVESLVFTLIDNETVYQVSQGAPNEANIVIPAVHNGLPVTKIADYGFEYSSSITSVTIPSSITSIGVFAFADCPNLTSVTMAEGVMEIGNMAFFRCHNLASINIPNGVISIGHYALAGCFSITSLNIPSSVTSIDDAFRACVGITSINVAEGNPVYRSEGNCLIQTSAVIFGCPTSEIPISVNMIAEYAFAECTSLTSITIPSSVIIISRTAFFNCRNLASVTIENGLVWIQSSAFQGCTSLTSIVFPNSVNNIHNNAFDGCSNLRSVFIPSSVMYMATDVFRNCGQLLIFTEWTAEPTGWMAGWNRNNRPVIWGATINPEAPAFLAARFFGNAAHLVWKPPTNVYSPYFISYAVYRDGVLIADTGITNPVFSDVNPPGESHSYYVTAVFTTGESEASNTVSVSSEGDVVGGRVTRLMGNYPNPFNPTTTIAFEIAREGWIVIEVFNNKGQKVKTLVNDVRGAGKHVVVWKGDDVSGRGVGSGVYFCKMVCGEFVEVRKMMVVK